MNELVCVSVRVERVLKKIEDLEKSVLECRRRERSLRDERGGEKYADVVGGTSGRIK